MNTKELLNKFTAKKRDCRDYLSRPFLLNGSTFAVNTRVAVLFKGEHTEDPEECENLKSIKNNLNDMFDGIESRSFSDNIVITKPDRYEACSECHGLGYYYFKECKECEGNGFVNLENDFNTYYGIECKSCDGDGGIMSTGDNMCSSCYGSGVKARPVEPEGCNWRADYNLLYLAMGNLDNVMFCKEHDNEKIYFKHSQGYGVVMGVR